MTTTAIQKPTSAIGTIRDLLERARPKLAEVTPKHLTPDRLIRVAIAAAGRTPALLKCSPASLLNSVMQAAQVGLEPGSALGEAYLVPYKDTCQLIIGYRGLISLARRSGQIVSIEAHVVHERDKFTCKYGMNPTLEHEPDWSAAPGEVIAVYAVAKLRDGGTQVEVMTRAQVDAIRARSKASGSGPWVTDYAEMSRKTVVRRLCKYLPLSIEMAEALAIDDATEGAEVVDVPASVEVPSDKMAGVKAKLAAKLGRPAAEEEVQVEPDSEHAEPEPGSDFAEDDMPESGEVRAPEQGAARQVRR